MYKLFLMRHVRGGPLESCNNRFTVWADVTLSDTGLANIAKDAVGINFKISRI